jgi:hypothetical protein
VRNQQYCRAAITAQWLQCPYRGTDQQTPAIEYSVWTMDDDKETTNKLSLLRWLAGWAVIIVLCAVFWLVVYSFGKYLY